MATQPYRILINVVCTPGTGRQIADALQARLSNDSRYGGTVHVQSVDTWPADAKVSALCPGVVAGEPLDPDTTARIHNLRSEFRTDTIEPNIVEERLKHILLSLKTDINGPFTTGSIYVVPTSDLTSQITRHEPEQPVPVASFSNRQILWDGP